MANRRRGGREEGRGRVGLEMGENMNNEMSRKAEAKIRNIRNCKMSKCLFSASPIYNSEVIKSEKVRPLLTLQPNALLRTKTYFFYPIFYPVFTKVCSSGIIFNNEAAFALVCVKYQLKMVRQPHLCRIFHTEKHFKVLHRDIKHSNRVNNSVASVQ